MELRSVSCASALVAVILSSAVALADEAKKYPDWEGLWNRGSPVGTWDPTKPGGLGQQAPLTPEYQKVLEANLAKGKAGVQFDIKGTCGPVGMPREKLWVHSNPSFQTRTSTLSERALTTETPTPCSPPEVS